MFYEAYAGHGLLTVNIGVFQQKPPCGFVAHNVDPSLCIVDGQAVKHDMSPDSPHIVELDHIEISLKTYDAHEHRDPDYNLPFGYTFENCLRMLLICRPHQS